MAITNSVDSCVPRRPLRERCQVKLTVRTTFSGEEDALVPSYIHEPQEIQRSHPMVNKPSPPTRPFLYTHDLALSFDAGPLDFLSKKSHLEELVRGLYVAFADDDFEVAALRTFDDEGFSHIVQITPVHSVTRVCEEGVDPITGACTFRLPFPAYGRAGDHPALRLLQLLGARDFMSLALPYQRGRFPFEGVSSCDANILVVAPTGRTSDILSIVACYLAFITSRHASTILKTVDEVEEFDQAWKGNSLTDRDIRLVDYVAGHV